MKRITFFIIFSVFIFFIQQNAFSKTLAQSSTLSIQNQSGGGDSEDIDNDGLPDEWELRYFGNLNQGPQDDPDDDGLLNIEEYLFGNNPTKNDNLLKYPSFEEGLSPHWLGYQTYQGKPANVGKAEVVSTQVKHGNKALYISNTDGRMDSRIGVVQEEVKLPQEKITTPLFFSYWIRPTKIEADALVTLDVYIEFVDDGDPKTMDYTYFIGPLRSSQADLNKWVRKTALFVPTRPVQRIRAYLLNYDGLSESYYDQVTIAPLAQGQDITISNNVAKLTISAQGYVKSLSYRDGSKEQVESAVPLSTVYLEDETQASCFRIEALGNNLYKINYAKERALPLEVILEILPEDYYFQFKIQEVKNNDPQVKIQAIDFSSINPYHIPQLEGEWAKKAEDNELFLNFLPLNVETVCANLYYTSHSFNCRANAREELKIQGNSLVGAMAALVAAPKSEYDNVIEAIARDPEYQLPLVILKDGRWLRNSDYLNNSSYLFVQITPDNAQELVKYARAAKFEHFMAIEPVLYGYYNRSRYFSPQEFRKITSAFTDAGIGFGIHTQINLVEPYEGLVDFTATAKPDNYLQQALFTEQLGVLTQDLNLSDKTISIKHNYPGLKENPLFKHYYLAGSPGDYERYGKEFLIGNEIITCENYNQDQLTQCNREQFTTKGKPVYSQGIPVYILPHLLWGAFYLNPKNTELVAKSTQGFAELASNIDGKGNQAEVLYFDGRAFPDVTYLSTPGGSWISSHLDADAAITDKFGVFPYIKELEQYYPFDYMPIIQLPGTSSIGVFYSAKGASSDGVVFKNKEFTKEYKTKSILKHSPYYRTKLQEYGWWKFHGAKLGDGHFDSDAVTLDDVHYVMGKGWALKAPLGLQLSEGEGSHYNYLQGSADQGYKKELFSLVGLYHQLIDAEKSTFAPLPYVIREYLQEPEQEAELNRIAGYNFVKKKTFRAYLEPEHNFLKFNNPFIPQKLILEIRPKPDYYPFTEDDKHLKVTDFSNAKGFAIRTSGPEVSCSINDGGEITVTNKSKTLIGGCEITIPGKFDFTNKRGFGLDITRQPDDNAGEELVLRLYKETGFGTRDFGLPIDFAGRKQVVMGDPNGYRVDWSLFIAHERNWDFDYGSGNSVKVYINKLAPDSTAHLSLHQLKALGEKKDRALINPAITLGNQRISFKGVQLKIDDSSSHILEYNGRTKTYKLYTSNYAPLGQGVLTADAILVAEGENSLLFNAEPGLNNENLQRAEIRVTVNDDPDNDGIPDDGSFGAGTKCNGKNNFCNDNCPTVYNPLQTDSDNNGKGDACDIKEDWLKADVNCDGKVNNFDIDPFIAVLTKVLTGKGGELEPRKIWAADCNDDTKVNMFDVEPFIKILTKAGVPEKALTELKQDFKFSRGF